MKAKLGIAPIAWWNDHLAELSDDVSLEECLRQASVTGFTGMETGRRFPMDMAAAIETEAERDLLMKHSTVPLLFDAGQMAFAGGDNLRVIENHWKRITHVHTEDVRMGVINALDRTHECFLDAVVKGAFTVPGDGSLDFKAIVKALAAKGYEGWFVVEVEQDPKVSPPLKMAKKGHKELMRVMAAAGYEVVQ